MSKMKGQITFEMIVGFSLTLIMFLTILSFFRGYLTDNEDLNDVEHMLDEFEMRVNVMKQSENHMNMSFTFPERINGVNYSVTMLQDSGLNDTILVVNYSGRKVLRYVPQVWNTSSVSDKGNFTLMRNESGVYLHDQ